MKHPPIAVVDALLLLLATPGAAQAVPAGSLDPTFSHDGIASSALLSAAGAVQVDAQNRVTVGGYNATKHAGVVLRYKADGTLDPTWKPYYLHAGYGTISGIAFAGTRTVIGTTGLGNHQGGRLIRLNANGSLDSTFGVKGVVAQVPAG